MREEHRWKPALRGVVRWVAVGVVGLFLLVAVATGEAAGALLLLGLLLLLVAVVAWFRDGWATFWVPGRRAAAGVAVFGVAALTTGGVLVDPTSPGPPPAGAPSSSAPFLPSAPGTTESPASTEVASPSSSRLAPSTSATPTRAASRTVTRPSPRPGTAAAALGTLAVKGRAPRTGYDRSEFGPAWTDNTTAPDGHNGCDTRNDVLRRDLRPVTVAAGTNGCLVLSGTLHDPYTAAKIGFTRGVGTSTRVQIDHVVALSDGWQKGAQRWAATTRAAFANDPMNLLAVDGPTNLRKSDGDAATWLPPNKSYRCAYVARQVSVKQKYGLAVTIAERDAIARVLGRCPNQPLVTETAATRNKTPYAVVRNRPTPTHVIRPLVPPAGSTSAGTTYYANCAAVRAAGKAPLRRGDPGYSRKLDRDGDGVACE